jgi:hypothetical protein
MIDELIYLASPYTHPDPQVREQRFQAVCRKAAELMRAGHLIYSPIAHSHPIAQYGLPKEFAFWQRLDEVFLGLCGRLWIYCIDGWQESHGIREEITFARATGRPIQYLEADSGPESSLTHVSILEEAQMLVGGDRRRDYGPPGADFARTAAIFNAWTGHSLNMIDALRFMICVKLSREANHHKRDNLTDACGYAWCLNEVHEEAQPCPPR